MKMTDMQIQLIKGSTFPTKLFKLIDEGESIDYIFIGYKLYPQFVHYDITEGNIKSYAVKLEHRLWRVSINLVMFYIRITFPVIRNKYILKK